MKQRIRFVSEDEYTKYGRLLLFKIYEKCINHVNKLCSPCRSRTISGAIFIADDSIGAESFPREIYFSSRDARKTESKRRVVSTIPPPCSPIFRNTRSVSKLFFSDRAPHASAIVFYDSQLRQKIEKTRETREEDVSRENVKHLFLTCRRCSFFDSSFSFLFYLRSSGGYARTQRRTIFTVLLL